MTAPCTVAASTVWPWLIITLLLCLQGLKLAGAWTQVEHVWAEVSDYRSVTKLVSNLAVCNDMDIVISVASTV